MSALSWPQHALVPSWRTLLPTLAVAAAAWWADALAVGILVLMLVAVWRSLGRRTHGPSAFSVFNSGQRALPGTLHAAELDALLRGGGAHTSASAWFDARNIEPGASYDGPPVPRNQPCPCGSGAKYKRCCGDPARENLFYGLDEEVDD